jgi:hypothetical protein
MSDRMSAEIWIGGAVPKRLVPELCQAIQESGASNDWSESNFAPETAEDLLGTVDGDGHLELMDHEARYGELPELEAFCREHGIAFDRQSDAKYEYSAELVRFRPEDGGQTFVTTTDQEGTLLVEVTAVLEVRDALRQGRAAEALRLLEELAPDIPDLPPLSFVD